MNAAAAERMLPPPELLRRPIHGYALSMLRRLFQFLALKRLYDAWRARRARRM